MMIGICAILLHVVFFVAPYYTYAEGGTLIGQATSDERGGISGGRAGNQSGKELSIDRWSYGRGAFKWEYVFRAKDPAIAKKLAENMKAACANKHIGYDRDYPDKTSLYDAAKAENWDISAVSVDCETTCVDVVSVCINAAGIDAPRNWSSSLVYGDLMPTDQFYCYTTKDYLASTDKLLPGDILCNPSGPHTAMVVESPNSFYFDVSYKDSSGEDQTTQVKDGDDIIINPNNGKKPISLKIETTTDLGQYNPKREGSTFKGWEQTGEGVFAAEYQSTLMPIRTGNKRFSID